MPPSHRAVTRPLIIAITLVATIVVAALQPGLADEAPPEFPPAPAIVFPVAAEVTFTDTFGAPRGGEWVHEGQDLMGNKLDPVVAAHDGTVKWIGNWDETPGGHYYLAIEHLSGWYTVYVHLNNDTPGTDDGLGGRRWAYASGIAKGVSVVAGQMIGYLGDSGDAENSDPHLHFELRRPDGVAVNPYQLLVGAPRVAVASVGTIDGVSTARGVHEARERWWFAEGYTAESFDTYLLLGNPGTEPVTATVSLQLPDGAVIPVTATVAPRARETLKLDDVVPAASVAISVAATGPLVAERAMYFENRGAVDGSASQGIAVPAPHWYFAEGYTGPSFETWLLVQNPEPWPVPTLITFLPGHGPPVQIRRTLAPTSRMTLRVGDFVAGDDVAQVVDALDGTGVVAERAVYVAEPGGRNGGTAAPGIPKLSAAWTFAEGTASDDAETWLLLANPSPVTTTVTVRVLTSTGAAGEMTLTIPPESRRTMPADQANLFGLHVVADHPIAAERAIYLANGASAAEGADVLSARWLFAEGYIGTGFTTTFTLANPGEVTATVTLRFDAPGGAATKSATVAVPPGGRATVPVTGLSHPEFATRVTSDVPIAAERTQTFGYYAP